MGKHWFRKVLAAVLFAQAAFTASYAFALEAGEENTEELSAEAEKETEAETESDAGDLSGIIIPDVSVEEQEIPDTEAIRFARSLKTGWNLGNTMDAFNTVNPVNDLTSETWWQPDITTKELMETLHEAGFETVRIPVSWHNHLKPNYTIKEAWLDRVQEIVDYAYDEGMHVILNIHHDNEEKVFCFYPDEENLEHSLHYIERIWEQLSERFADYDERLIFESMNEPRLMDHPNEWWLDLNNADCRRAVEIINELNQRFVDTVRAGGGFNEERYLMVPGYDASADGALCDAFVLPEDEKERVMVSVHAYTPYNFALNLSGTNRFSASSSASTRDIDSFMDRLYERYTVNGIAVVLGEFGALDKKGNLQDRVDFTAYYRAYAASKGFPCLWWDNNAFSGDGENFGLINRGTLEWTYPEIVEAMMRYGE